jgi:predicted small secreted protein
MKKIGLLTTLLVGGLLLTGCTTLENPVEIDS